MRFRDGNLTRIEIYYCNISLYTLYTDIPVRCFIRSFVVFFDEEIQSHLADDQVNEVKRTYSCMKCDCCVYTVHYGLCADVFIYLSIYLFLDRLSKYSKHHTFYSPFTSVGKIFFSIGSLSLSFFRSSFELFILEVIVLYVGILVNMVIGSIYWGFYVIGIAVTTLCVWKKLPKMPFCSVLILMISSNEWKWSLLMPNAANCCTHKISTVGSISWYTKYIWYSHRFNRKIKECILPMDWYQTKSVEWTKCRRKNVEGKNIEILTTLWICNLRATETRYGWA